MKFDRELKSLNMSHELFGELQFNKNCKMGNLYIFIIIQIGIEF